MDRPTLHGKSFWYAVTTRSRQEKVAASILGSLGIRHLLPLTTEVHRWSDRKQTVSLPLFPGYLFVNITQSSETRLHVLKVPGIVNFVGSPHGPAAIPEREIDSVRAVLSHGVECFPSPFLTAGTRVRIVQGVLTGIEGTFIRAGRDSKLIISIEMIQRSLAVNVRSCDIEQVSPGNPSYVPRESDFFKARTA
jgi:transcription antitermination factor NusG